MASQERFPAYGGEGPQCLRLGLSLGSIATLFLLLRFYVRLRVNNHGGWALSWVACAWTATVATQVFGVLSILHGLGNHITVVAKSEQLGNFLFFTWMTFFFFNLAIPLGKVAVCAFLIEVQAGVHPRIRLFLIVLAAFNMIIAVPQMLLVWFQCTPVQALWDPLRQTACNHDVAVKFTYFTGATAAATDLALAIVPSFILWPLHIDRRLKLCLCALMATGVFTAVAAVLRTRAAMYILVEDSTYELWWLFLWGELEEWLAIICACIPAVWPLFRPVFERFLSSVDSRLYRDTGSPSVRWSRRSGRPMSLASSETPAAEFDSGGRQSRATAASKAWTAGELDEPIELSEAGQARAEKQLG